MTATTTGQTMVILCASEQDSEHPVEDDDEDVADSLKRVCDEARTNGSKIRRCRQRPTGVKNCLFVTVQGADVTFMIQLVRKTMMVGGIPNYYLKRKYNMHPKEEKPDGEKTAAEVKEANETASLEDQKVVADDQKESSGGGGDRSEVVTSSTG
ncbi:hypothetical protein TELCIR_12600 [Teladorsagia circumcincta]|uniref:THUMP domain-containing protein n=1 Tax=Teladorsagia circumcincta TaxID=45464 RepID=A0A2G9U661_TELCI|nr:hypothetical protein TELCIR_12600 [Teladorsagia circumcincta]